MPSVTGVCLALVDTMLRTPGPLDLFHQQTAKLQSQLAAVRNGDADGIHQARVATRRIRELLPLTAEWHRPDAVDGLADGFRLIGRALGRVRDADVQIALLRYLEARVPGAAPTLIVVRQEREHRRLRLMRSLIKECERLDIDHFLHRMRSEFGRRSAIRKANRWDRQLRGAIRDRAAAMRDAIDHATGIYFPNRAHRVRIAIKKFRYAAEIAAATTLWNAHEIIRELKKGQEVLGDLHDRQSLIDHLPQEGPPQAAAVDSMPLHLVVQVVEAEAQDLHQQYLRRRPRLLEAAAVAHRHNHPHERPALWPLAAGVAVASSTLVLMRHSGRQDDFVRIPRARPGEVSNVAAGSQQTPDQAANVTQAS